MDLFSIKLIKKQIKHQELIKNYIEKNVCPYYEKYGPNDKDLGNYTDYVEGAISVDWRELLFYYKDVINENLIEYGVDYNLPWQIKTTAWYNISNHIKKIFPHTHTGGPRNIQFSMVHYVSLPETAESTIFVNPNLDRIKSTIPTKDLSYMPDCYKDFEIRTGAVEGDSVFFPSWLEHYSPLYQGSKNRITVAMNIMIWLNDEREGL